MTSPRSDRPTPPSGGGTPGGAPGGTPGQPQYADRAYRSDGTLVSRREEGAVLHDPEQIAERVVRMVQTGRLLAVDGSTIDVQVESVCVHGDSPGAVQIATAVREYLLRDGVELTAFV